MTEPEGGRDSDEGAALVSDAADGHAPNASQGGLLEKIVRLAVFNSVFVNLLFWIIVAAGLAAAMLLPREQFPEVTLDRVSVLTAYPGATATDVEELITREVEEALEDVDDVDRVISVSSEGASNVVVTFLSGKDLQDGRAEIEKAVATLDALPEDSETPIVRELALELPVVTVAVRGDISARSAIERIRDELGAIPGVATTTLSGITERRIIVELDEDRVRALGIQAPQVAAVIRASRANVPAGTIEGAGGEIFVKTDQRINSAEDVANIPLSLGSRLRIGDVARVRNVEELPDTRIYVDGVPAVQIVVSREDGADPLRVRTRVIALLDDLQVNLSEGTELSISEDYTPVIRDRLGVLAFNGLTGGLLVIIVLSLVAGFRQALLALWGMPVSYLLATLLMWKTGITINVISTFALLIATGIVVDDAIVVIENTQRHLEMGKDRVRAALDGTREVLVPVTAAVTTTCLAFLPLTMVGGTIGRVMKILPLVVIFCLIGSLVEAIFILPGHVAAHAKSDGVGGRTARILARMQAVYRPVLEACLGYRGSGARGGRGLSRRLVSVGLGGLLFLGTLGLATKGMEFQLNAPGKPYETTVSFSLYSGADRHATQRKAEAVRAEMGRGVGGGNIRSAKARIGSSLDQRSGSVERGSNVGQIRFELVMGDELVARHGPAIDAVKDMLTADPDISSFSVKVPQAGPPAGAEFSARLRGRDPAQVLKASGAIKTFLSGRSGVTEVLDDLGLGKETFRVVVDQDLASLYGMSERDVGRTVRTAIDGLLADEVSIDETQVEIVVRYRDGMILDRSGLGSIPLTTQSGTVVRLDEVAEVVRTREAGSLRRRDNQRQIEVQGNLDGEVVSVSEINGAVRSQWDGVLALQYPGVDLAFGGETEDFNESLRDLIPAFGLVLGLIFVVLALQFRSYLQPLIILSAVPFGIIGAVWGLFLMGYDLSLFAFFGIVALAGIVVNDSLVMVDFINKRVAEGAEVSVAIVDGALARLRPILTTTLTTVFGLAPLALGLGGKDEILAPMAISIAGGLAISTGLVLLLVPVLYALVDDLVRGWERWRAQWRG